MPYLGEQFDSRHPVSRPEAQGRQVSRAPVLRGAVEVGVGSTPRGDQSPIGCCRSLPFSEPRAAERGRLRFHPDRGRPHLDLRGQHSDCERLLRLPHGLHEPRRQSENQEQLGGGAGPSPGNRRPAGVKPGHAPSVPPGG